MPRTSPAREKMLKARAEKHAKALARDELLDQLVATIKELAPEKAAVIDEKHDAFKNPKVQNVRPNPGRKPS